MDIEQISFLFLVNWPRIFFFESMRYIFAALVVLGLLAIVERSKRKRRIQERQASRADRKRERRNSIRSLAIFAIGGVGTFGFIKSGLAPTQSGLPDWPVALLEFALIVVAHDAYFYWMHRGLHWRRMRGFAHSVHHLSKTPTVWAAYSFSMREAVLEGAFLPCFILIVPFHEVMIVAFLVHQILRNVVGHCGHELAWPGFSRSPWTGWLTTTTHHDLHHCRGRWNFGLYFTWWDRWMGTEHPQYNEAFDRVAKTWWPTRLRKQAKDHPN